MRAKLTEQLREAAVNESNAVAERRALDQVTEASTFEVPKTLIAQTAEQNYQDSVRRLLSMRMPMGVIEEREAEMRAHAEQEALSEIKRIVLLNEVGDAEGVEVTEEDFEQEMESMAARMGLDLNVLGDYVGADEGRRNQYEERIFRAKALKVIMDNAKVTEREMSREELEAQLKDESGETDEPASE
jgi:trigger factor